MKRMPSLVAETALSPSSDRQKRQRHPPGTAHGLDFQIDAADHATKLAGSSFLPTLSFVADSGVQGTGYARSTAIPMSPPLRWC